MNKVCKIDFKSEEFDECSDHCMSLLKWMLKKKPEKRPTAE